MKDILLPFSVRQHRIPVREKYDTEIVRTARTDTDRRTVETQILISLNLELGSMIRDR